MYYGNGTVHQGGFLFLSSCSLNTWGIVIRVLVTTVDLKTCYNDMMFPLQKKGGSKRHEHDTRQLVRHCDTISTGPCIYIAVVAL